MADEIDRASDLETAERDALIAAIRARPSMPCVGHCYNCGSEVANNILFCDSDCSKDYQKRHPGHCR